MAEERQRRNSLMLAAGRGHVEIMRILLDVSGVHVDEKNSLGGTALMFANNVDMARFLISRGANVREKSLSKSTPLMLASIHGHLDVVQLLLSYGVTVDDISDHGSTALKGAIEKNHVDVIRALIDNGADVNLSDFTLSLSPPLMYAARIGNMEVVRLLISKGAVPTYTSRSMLAAPASTAEALARASGHTAVADYLGEIVRKYGAFTIDRKIPDGKEKFTFVY
jgi:ankyrin repeat protein